MNTTSKTRKISIIGVMLMSARNPKADASFIVKARLPFNPHAGNGFWRVCRLLAGHYLRSHDANVIHVRRMSYVNDIRDGREVHVIVALDEHHPLRTIGVNVG